MCCKISPLHTRNFCNCSITTKNLPQESRAQKRRKKSVLKIFLSLLLCERKECVLHSNMTKKAFFCAKKKKFNQFTYLESAAPILLLTPDESVDGLKWYWQRMFLLHIHPPSDVRNVSSHGILASTAKFFAQSLASKLFERTFGVVFDYCCSKAKSINDWRLLLMTIFHTTCLVAVFFHCL